MKMTIYHYSAIAALAATTLLCGCRSTSANFHRADRTGDMIGDFRDDVISIQKAITATDAALDEIVRNAHTDPRRPYRNFTESLKAVEAANQKALQRADDMRAEGKVFFDLWQEDLAKLNNPEIRQLAEERRFILQDTFRNISHVTVQGRDDYRAWLSDVKDLQILLGNDLTVASIDATRPLIAKSKANAAKVRQTYQNLVAELDSVANAITPTRGTP
jgi:hypothetical protein